MALPATFRVQKKLRVRNNTGRTIEVLREHYVRHDIPCQSQLCQSCRSLPGFSPVLAADATHYVIPDIKVAETCLDVLEHPCISSVIWLQTVVGHVQRQCGRRHYARLRSLISNSQRQNAVFTNEQRAECWEEHRGQFASLQHWYCSLVHRAAVYLSLHLDSQVPIVIITRSQEFIDTYGDLQAGVFVIHVSEYVQSHWGHEQNLVQLFDSLSATWLEDDGDLTDKRRPRDKASGFTDYKPMHELQEGLRLGHYKSGRLQVSKYFPQQEAYIDGSRGASRQEKDGLLDIHINGPDNRNRAVHSDNVVVEVLPRSQWTHRTKRLAYGEAPTVDHDEEAVSSSPCGRVVGVLAHNWREYVVLLPPQDLGPATGGTSGTSSSADKGKKVLVYPFDCRIPKIRISTRQAESLRGQRFVARIDSWEKDSQYPNGHFVRLLGPAGQLETEISTILVESSINVAPFTPAMEKELPSNTPENPWLMDPEEIARRRDLRKSHLIFSIDPKGCEDVDDALSARRLADGKIELGVHIADVTHFVKPGTLVDEEARSRATTVYLADRRFDMLPRVLSSDLCSLHSSVDRYAVSVFCEMNSEFEIKKVRFARTIIRSRYKLEYGVAQSVIDGATDAQVQEKVSELRPVSGKELKDSVKNMRSSLHLLSAIAASRRRLRNQSGALELESNEVGIQISDDRKSVENILPKQALEIHETVAECMIFANELVARQIAKHFPRHALLRRHSEPRFERFDQLLACAEARNFTITTSSNNALAQSLNRCQDAADTQVNTVMRMLATRAMSQAQYISLGSVDTGDGTHYGLALERYTHFTSPIRRYADVIVHRQLLESVSPSVESCAADYASLPRLAEHMNGKKRDADCAQKVSMALFQTLYFRSVPADSDACVTTVIVYQILRNGLKVYSPRFGLNGPLYLQNKDGLVVQRASLDSNLPVFGSGCVIPSKTSSTVDGVSSSLTFSLFDHLKVRIELVPSDLHPPSLRYHLLSCDPVVATAAATTGAAAAESAGDMSRFNPVKALSQTGEKSAINNSAASASSKHPEASAQLGMSAEELSWKQTPKSSSLYHVLLKMQRLALKPDP